MKESLPGFKKKRQGLASKLRDYFLGRLTKNNKDFDNETKGASLLAPTEARVRKEMAPASLATELEDTKSPELGSTIQDALALVKSGGVIGDQSSELIDSIIIPKVKRKKTPVKISDTAPTPKTEAVDKGVSISNSMLYANPDVKKQTRVKDEFKLQLRYTMPKKLSEVPDKQLKNLSQWISTQLTQIERERSEFMERLLNYRSMWLDFVSTGMQPIFEGAHNVHIPVIFEKIKAMHSRIYQAVLGIDPPFSLKPRDKVTETQKYEKEQLLNYIIKDFANMGRGWEETVDRDIWNFVADGTSITKQDWKRDVRKFTDVKDEFNGFKLGEPQFTQVEFEREEVIYDGPMLKTVNIEDFYIAGIFVDSPDEADLCAERNFFTKSDLIKLSQQDYFFKDAIDKVLSTDPLDINQIDSLDYSTFKQQQRNLAGVDREVTGHKYYEIFETYCRWDIDQDGIDEELVVWYEKRSGLILRMTYLERAAPGAIRPFTVKRFINRPGSPYGIGMAEMMYGINNAQDYIVNQRLDYGTIRNLPFGFVRAASGTKPKEIKLAPGTLYPLDNPQEDVYMPPMNGGTAYGFQEEEKIEQYGDKVSSISGFNLGSTASQGATRTATGAAALVSEINTNLDIHIKRYQRGYKRNLYILDKQVQQLLPLGTVIRMLGPDGKVLLGQFENRKALEFSSDFELTANSVSSNKAIERDTANMLLQVLQNPLALQSGIVSPKNLYNVYRNLLQKAEIKDFDAFITRPEGAEESPYTAKDELTMILGGVKPPIYQMDRHAEKLAFFEAFEQSEDLSWYGPEQLELYRKTKKAHEDMANAVAAQMTVQGQNTSGQMQSLMASQLAAGGGVPQQQPAQQISDLAPQSGPAVQS
jgi:hypothetical protein